MKKYVFIIIAFCITFFLTAAPAEYSDKTRLTRQDFFEENYREVWNSLSEMEQFAIACSSNIFQRNKQYHLDFSNRIVFSDNTRPGIEVLNENWDIYDYKQLMENYNELAEGEQAEMYRELAALLEKNPDLSIIDIGKKECLTVSAVSRLYMIQSMKDILGKHGIEAWIEARMISIIRWGIGAGYISEEEGRTLIEPVVKKVKDDYSDFEDFIAHWIAGYCFNAVFDSTCPDCTKELLYAVEAARAYIPFEELPFTGKNADAHTMKINEGVYTPSKLAEKMIPLQKVYKRYQKEEPSEDIYKDLLKEEENYPEVSDLLVLSRFVLMCKYSSPQERVKYVAEKEEYLNSINKETDTYNVIMKIYAADLINTNKPEKCITLYKELPQSLQNDAAVYYNYGYANYLMSYNCLTIIEKDIYNSRARDVFNRLKARDYKLGDFISKWLEATENSL